MKTACLGAAAALTLLLPSVVRAAPESASAVQPEAARVVEIRVDGDAAALVQVRITARELLLRLGVVPEVRASDEPASDADATSPLVIAYIDLRDVSAPSIEIQDGRSHEPLTQRELSDVSSLETAVEAALHVLYLSLESMGELEPPAPPPAPEVLPAKPPPVIATPPKPVSVRPSRAASRSPFALDFGALLRLSSLGSSRIVPGGGIALEPRLDAGTLHAGLLLSSILHATTDLDFDQGRAELRPFQLRATPTLDLPLSDSASGCFGLGLGLDAFLLSPRSDPQDGRAVTAKTALDPIVSALIGARMPISKRVTLGALASVDLDLEPSRFVARQGSDRTPILALPRVRGGFTLALSFTAVGRQRFEKVRLEP